MLDYALRPIAVEKDYRASDLSGSWRYMFDKYPEIEPWVDSLRQVAALKDTFVVASDGARLHAFYVTSPDTIRQTAVIVHGYTDNAVRMLMIGYLTIITCITISCCRIYAMPDRVEAHISRWDGMTVWMCFVGWK